MKKKISFLLKKATKSFKTSEFYGKYRVHNLQFLCIFEKLANEGLKKASENGKYFFRKFTQKKNWWTEEKNKDTYARTHTASQLASELCIGGEKGVLKSNNFSTSHF